jgi:hypothetical protein
MIARVGVQRLFLRGEGIEQRENRLAVDVLVVPPEQELDRDGDPSRRQRVFGAQCTRRLKAPPAQGRAR